MKKFTYVIILLFLLLAACSDSESTEEEPNQVEENTEVAAAETEVKPVQEEDTEETMETNELKNDVEYPPIPTSFEDATEYPLVGQFAGDAFTNQPEMIEILNSFPKLTDENSEEELEQWKRYLWTLFKEDFSQVNVPINQWDSMKFDDPTGETKGVQLKENYNIALLLDSSGSMANYENDRTRMDLAKEAIEQFVQDLPDNANVSLYVYGHEGSGSDEDKAKSCSTIEEVYPLSSYESEAFTEALNQFEPAGWTPMADTIDVVTEQLKEYDGEHNTNIIYLVSDGVETCDGDPVEAVKALADSNIEPVLNIIGYQVDNEGLAQLKEMAQVSDARYINATSQADLVTEFEQTVDMSQVWSHWHNNSKDTISALYNTIRDQLSDWYNAQNERIIREYKNLDKAVHYLYEQEIIGPNVYLDYNGDVASYYLQVNGDVANTYLDLTGTNANEFLDINGDISERFLDSLK